MSVTHKWKKFKFKLYDFENMSTIIWLRKHVNIKYNGQANLILHDPLFKILKYFIINIDQNSNFIPIFNFNFLKVMDIRIFQ